MKKQTTTLLASLVLASLTAGSAAAELIISDDFNVTGSGTGFNLNTGVNSGINPPSSTRLTGSQASNVRYLKSGSRSGGLHYITNNAALGISSGANPTWVALSPDLASSASGLTNVFDFGPALRSTDANPWFPSVYEMTIDMNNYTPTAARCSFGISSGANWGLPSTWDFGIEIYLNTITGNSYTLQERVNGGSLGGSDLDATIVDSIGTLGQPISFLFRVTDAGAESGTAFHSRLQLAVVDPGAGTTNWIYDTQSDTTGLPSGWRFTGPQRSLYMYAAKNAGPIVFDNLSLNLISSPAPAGVRTWTGAGPDNNWSTAANWDGPAPVYDALVFAGATRQTSLNDLSTLIAPWLRFDNGGFRLEGNVLNLGNALTNSAGNNTLALPISWAGAGLKIWSVAPGTELTLLGPVASPVNGDHQLMGGGLLRIQNSYTNAGSPDFEIHEGRLVFDGATYSANSGGIRLGSVASIAGPAELLATNGALIELLGTGANVRVGDSARPGTNRLFLDNTTLAMQGGSLSLPYAAGATGEVFQVGGSLSQATIEFSRLEGMGTYSVRNGALILKQIKKTKTAGYAEMYFDNATLSTAPGTVFDFLSGLDVAEIRSGGLTLEVTQNDVAIAQALSGPGGFKKTGPLSASLTGANSFSGPLVVEAGQLTVQAGQIYGAIELKDFTSLEVALPTANTTLTGASLTLASSTLTLPLGSLPNPAVPLVAVGALAANAPVTINITGGTGLDVGQFVLIDYSGTIGGTGFPAFTLGGTLPSGMVATLVNNTANSSIDLLVSQVPGLNWKGNVNSDWDVGATANWIDSANGSATVYADSQNTRFKDDALTGNVTLTGPVSPAMLTVNNDALPYVFSGAGPLYTPLLVKQGTNSLTRLDGTMDWVGQLALNYGSLVLSNSADVTSASVLSDSTGGQGTLVKEDVFTLTLTGDSSTYHGSFIVKSGTLKLGSSTCLGVATGAVTVVTGASLDVNNLNAPHKPVIVSGPGVNGQGAIVNNTPGGGVQNNLTDVSMVGDTVFGCIAGGRWDIRVRPATGPDVGLRGNGYNLTKVGGGTLSISSQRTLGGATPYWEMNLGDILVSEGSIAFEEATDLGNPERSLTLLPGTTMNLFDLGLTNPIVRNLTISDASLTCGGQTTHTNILNGSVLMTGSISIRPNNANLIINGAMSGDANVTIGANPNPGTVILNGTNTYTGDTTVTNSTLSGSGSLAGNLVITGGGLAPGYGVGSFTVAGNAALAGATRMELAPGQLPNCDQLNVAGSITGGGTLTVVLADGASAPQPGEVFQLFNQGVTGFTGQPSLPTLPPGLVWDTTNLALDGSLRVGVVAPAIGNVSLAGTTFTFSGTGGIEGNTYYVLTSTNVAAPLSSWTPLATNLFGTGGSFSFSMDISSAPHAGFFRLQIP